MNGHSAAIDTKYIALHKNVKRDIATQQRRGSLNSLAIALA
jgi:hypothetical protein